MTLQRIIAEFEADYGERGIPPEDDQKIWDAGTQAQRDFLINLSDADLKFICIESPDEEGRYLIGGVWQELPPGVDVFLNALFEGAFA